VYVDAKGAHVLCFTNLKRANEYIVYALNALIDLPVYIMSHPKYITLNREEAAIQLKFQQSHFDWIGFVSDTTITKIVKPYKSKAKMEAMARMLVIAELSIDDANTLKRATVIELTVAKKIQKVLQAAG
jgi:hypothetical protein